MEKGSVAAVCVVYDDIRWLPQMIASTYDEVAALYFLVGEKSWNGVPSSNLKTIEFLETEKKERDPNDRIHIIRGNWESETDQRNDGLSILREAGYEYCLIIDTDEIYSQQHLRQMIRHIRENPSVVVWQATFFAYWKSLQYRIDPPESYLPTVFVKPEGASFSHYRLTTGEPRGVIPPDIGVCHHLSYARSDDEIYRKITTFSHVDEMQPDWFDRVWKGWDNNHDMLNIHPTHPYAYLRAIKVEREELPEALQPLYEQKVE